MRDPGGKVQVRFTRFIHFLRFLRLLRLLRLLGLLGLLGFLRFPFKHLLSAELHRRRPLFMVHCARPLFVGHRRPTNFEIFGSSLVRPSNLGRFQRVP